MTGKLITLEGIEGAGKSTALQFIKDYLLKLNQPVVWGREPGGTPLAEEIRNLLLHPLSEEVMVPEAELLLMYAARAQHLKNVILPALQAGTWVVCDRFVDASYAYQGGGRGIPLLVIDQLTTWIVGKLQPDLTLLLDIDPQAGFDRAEKRGTEKDRIEQEKLDFFINVRANYLERASLFPERIKVIDASLPIFAVENQIRAELDSIMVGKMASVQT